jgi:hypothetical protein
VIPPKSHKFERRQIRTVKKLFPIKNIYCGSNKTNASHLPPRLSSVIIQVTRVYITS